MGGGGRGGGVRSAVGTGLLWRLTVLVKQKCLFPEISVVSISSLCELVVCS